MQFTERYFERNDTFIIEESKQQCIVMESPIRKSDNFWEYTVRLIDSTYRETLDLTSCQIGMTTRFVSNIQPEYHEEGKLIKALAYLQVRLAKLISFLRK
jgi:hypothetical protein